MACAGSGDMRSRAVTPPDDVVDAPGRSLTGRPPQAVAASKGAPSSTAAAGMPGQPAARSCSAPDCAFPMLAGRHPEHSGNGPEEGHRNRHEDPERQPVDPQRRFAHVTSSLSGAPCRVGLAWPRLRVAVFEHPVLGCFDVAELTAPPAPCEQEAAHQDHERHPHHDEPHSKNHVLPRFPGAQRFAWRDASLPTYSVMSRRSASVSDLEPLDTGVVVTCDWNSSGANAGIVDSGTPCEMRQYT